MLNFDPHSISHRTTMEKFFKISISWKNKSTAIKAMTHSCTTKPNNQFVFWAVGAAGSEIDFEQHLRWLHTTFPLYFLADDKHGHQIVPCDPQGAHILLNTEPDYPREQNTHKHACTHILWPWGKWGWDHSVLSGQGQVGSLPKSHLGHCGLPGQKMYVCL